MLTAVVRLIAVGVCFFFATACLQAQSCPVCNGGGECSDGSDPVCTDNGWSCGDATFCAAPPPDPQNCSSSSDPEVACTDSGWACECPGYPDCEGTPIVIDPLGQGFHLTSFKNGVKFSFGGKLMQTSWTDNDYSNGWLALDRNGNGTIDDATELFGNYTPQPPGPDPNGFKALAVFDEPRNGGNGNGKIDPGDAIYSHLLLWIDRNHDGISQPDELIPLAQAGVFSIDLNYVESDKADQFGNHFRYLANISDKASQEDPRCYDVVLVQGTLLQNNGKGQ